MNTTDLRELFHENTKNYDTRRWYDDGDHPDAWSEVEYRTYPRCDSINIEYPNLSDISLGNVLETRQSPSEFADTSVDFEDLCGLLSGVKITHEHNGTQYRAYPSGGARYAPELYISTRDVDNIVDGIYHFNVRDDELEQLDIEPLQDEIADMSINNQPADAPIIAIITAVLARTEGKYGIRGYRYAHIASGHLVQNLLLCAEVLELSGRPWGDILEEKIDATLPLSETETTIYTALFGPVNE
jgi:SagB-type dehydrogenase family enzyme